MKHYDCIVVGGGGVGSAAAYHLAKRNARTLLIDRHRPPHELGSSHGQTRVIRQAYFENPFYVPLLKRAYELWAELEGLSEKKLFHKAGLLHMGLEESSVVQGTLASAKEHGIPIEKLSGKELQSRFPSFLPLEGGIGLFEPGAGYLFVEDCVQAHLDAASEKGVEFAFEDPVKSWRAQRGGVVVQTESGTVSGRRLILCAGPWMPEVLTDLNLKLQVLRKSVFWYSDSGLPEDLPCYLYQDGDEIFYGTPPFESRIGKRGIKLAKHSGGVEVSDPNGVDRELDPSEQAEVEAFLKKYLPSVESKVLGHDVCLYTVTPDHDFVIDFHPRFPQVLVIAGLSGHGFKFTSVLGEIASMLAMDLRPSYRIDFLNARRQCLFS